MTGIRRTTVGRQAEEIVAQGGLVPDEIMLQVVTTKLDALRNKVGPLTCILSISGA